MADAEKKESLYQKYCHDMLTALLIIMGSKDSPMYATRLPRSITLSIGTPRETHFTAVRFDKERYRFFLTAKGIEFLLEYSVHANIAFTKVSVIKKGEREAYTLSHIYVRGEDGIVSAFTNTEKLPTWVLEKLKEGKIVAYQDETYGTSMAQLQ